MARKFTRKAACPGLLGTVVALLFFENCVAQGGIATDGSVGGPGSLHRPQVLSGPGNTPSEVAITENLGSRAGGNLFHSFSRFNIAKDQTVTFTEESPGSTRNVISRVTGPENSTIEGTLRSTPGGRANFYLINPRGVAFGPGARIDVPGDFHVSTADYLAFKDGSRLVAHSGRSHLSSVEPAAFGFLGSTPANNGLLAAQRNAHLDAKPGGTIDLVGGTMMMDRGSKVSAPGGEIRVVAMKGPGLVLAGRDGKGHLPLPKAQPSSRNAGMIGLDNGDSGIDTSGDNGGGRIALWGGTVAVGRGAVIAADNAGSAPAGRNQGIIIRADQLRLEDGGMVRALAKTGSSGSIRIATTGDASFLNGGLVASVATAGGNAGNVSVTTGGKLRIDGKGTLTGISASAEQGSRGRAGNIDLNARGGIEIAEIGQIVSQTRGAGRAGNITVKTGGNLVVDARGQTADRQGGTDTITGIETGAGDRDAGIAATGNAGRVRIEAAGGVTLRNQGEISSFTAGSGHAGSVLVQADRVSIEGSGSDINAQAYTENSSGRTGTVIIEARSAVEVSENGKISIENKTTLPHARIKSSELSITAPEVILRSGGEISSDSSNLVDHQYTGTADAADISIAAERSLSLTDGARIRTTANEGRGGDVRVRSGGTVFLIDASLTTSSRGARNGGDVRLAAPVLLLDQGEIKADAKAGNGGNVTLTLRSLFAMGNILNGQVFSGEESRVPVGDRQATGNVIRAFSESGLNGTITLSGPLLNLSGDLANLGAPEYEAEALNRNCRIESAGSLIEQGRGALPRRADDSLLY